MSNVLAIPEDPAAVLQSADDPEQFVLVALDRAKAWLVTAGSIENVNDLRAKAEAIRVYTVQAHLGREAEQAACEIRLRAERRTGELVKQGQAAGEIGGHGGDRRSSRKAPDLKAVGLTHDEAAAFQDLAEIPEPEFEERVAVLRSKGDLSRAAVIRKHEAEKREADEQAEWHAELNKDVSEERLELAARRSEVVQRVMAITNAVDEFIRFGAEYGEWDSYAPWIREWMKKYPAQLVNAARVVTGLAAIFEDD